MKTLICFVLFAMVPMSAWAQQDPANTASGVMYLNSAETDMIRLINEVRIHPKEFAEKYLKGNSNKAARECYDELIKLAPMDVLLSSRSLAYAAQDHATDMGIMGKMGHVGSSDNSTPETRAHRYAQMVAGGGENVSYGLLRPLDIVLQLLIDDQVEGRGHRKNLLNKDFRLIGVAIRAHTMHTWNAVQDFAIDVTDKTGLVTDRSAYSFTAAALAELNKPSSLMPPANPYAGPALNEVLIAGKGYYRVGFGLESLPSPNCNEAAGTTASCSVHEFRIDLGYMVVNQSIMHLFDLNLGIGGGSDFLIAGGYGFGVGPRQGNWHVGLKASLGYAHMDNDGEDGSHGLYLALSPFVSTNLGMEMFKDFQFIGVVGLSLVPLTSVKVEESKGFNIGIGAAWTLE